MAYEVPASKKSLKQNRFEFTIEDEKFDVPLMKFMTGDQVKKMAEAAEAGGMLSIDAQYDMFGPADSKVGRAVRTLDFDQLEALTQAWIEASGVAPGESPASTGS